VSSDGSVAHGQDFIFLKTDVPEQDDNKKSSELFHGPGNFSGYFQKFSGFLKNFPEMKTGKSQ